MKKMLLAFVVMVFASGLVFGSGLSGTFTQEFMNTRELILDSLFIPVTITGHSGVSCRIEAFDIPREVEVFIEEGNGSISLRVQQQRNTSLPPGQRARLVISLPAAAACQLSSASGSFAVTGLSGPTLQIRSASGAVHCFDTAVPLDIQTSSGAISISGSQRDTVLKSASGAIKLERSQGDAVIEAISGAITVENVNGAIKADSTSGAIAVRGFQGRLYLTSVSGRISGSNLQLQGEGRFATTSGAIDLDVLNQAADCRCTAVSVTGAIELFGNRGHNNMQLGSGSLRLELRTVSGQIKLY
ncbi:MAG: hypothetical protein A2087_07055 [Spirochaetes bacterium GWD1_61_31]|nr:MAG: hypothetical protein A2Y37_08415 [Spirochaetes bacterium GWB1_60_80]OHD28486.1 MAG: hypothetical protein A2004_14845 [Spirochaetes bacterium GWC1_61_12]OHD40103.1 MAG: hypothetical protein A2087_07055 [Spirochaetes bacterium GWD1_61_31]OHD45849.1 MAG: hypothetical protein A2Y35_04050 [Spirochaetes bacterium GWE1_60_18]OHD58392.1 MAG: hypothetical protein A2Y32_06440 [Spirochaetes bacterium GWF1_60_12]